jgi:hypothetical protein
MHPTFLWLGLMIMMMDFLEVVCLFGFMPVILLLHILPMLSSTSLSGIDYSNIIEPIVLPMLQWLDSVQEAGYHCCTGQPHILQCLYRREEWLDLLLLSIAGTLLLEEGNLWRESGSLL